MRMTRIIHKQICQLRWHLLACLGLIMVLPIEEAAVSLKEGSGFYSSGMVTVSLMFAPLLTGLIACANVQGDLEERRYIFWRSKPVNVKLFITLKFFTGLIASLIIMACPVIFGLVLSTFYADYLEDKTLQYFLPFPVLISIMTYSLCFGCNVLVRSTARAWLIGMLLAGLLLTLPFLLPLDYKDYFDLFYAWGIYLTIMPIAIAAAFIFALYAAQYDWHLRTNLKGLLWVGTGLVFVLMMLFSSQVANIKVLQEKEIESPWWGRDSLDYVGDRILFQGQSFVDIDKNKISFSDIDGSPDDITVPITRMERYHNRMYPRWGGLIKEVGDNLYFFYIYAYYRTNEEEPPSHKEFYEKVYLRSYKYIGDSWTPVCEVDISDCLADSTYPQIAMRLIGNTIIAFINNSLAIVDVTDPKELKLIDKKLDVLKGWMGYYHERRKEFAIPLVPAEEIGIKERIKLSIDWNYRFSFRNDIYESSIVDIHDEKISFFLVSNDDIARFDVTSWDDENIYCKFNTARPLTILEGITGELDRHKAFVKGDKLYCPGEYALLVFDIHSNRRIRKLGHFVRMDYRIDDIAVLDDGNILLLMYWSQNLSKSHNNQFKSYLCLLENP